MAVSKKSSRQIEKEANDRVMQTIAWRAAFYRANPQRFVKDYLNINLKWFQAIILWSMFHFTYVMYLAARGQGKTFLAAIYCVTRCILYPGTEIAIASKTRKQSEKFWTRFSFSSFQLRHIYGQRLRNAK